MIMLIILIIKRRRRKELPYVAKDLDKHSWGDYKSWNSTNQIKSNQLFVFGERGKLEYPGEKHTTFVKDKGSHHCANPTHWN